MDPRREATHPPSALERGPRRWKRLLLVLTGLSLALSQLSKLSDGAVGFVKAMDERVYRAARNLNPLGLAGNYYAHVSTGEPAAPEARAEKGPTARGLVRSDETARLFGYRDLDAFRRQKAVEESLRRLAQQQPPRPHSTGPVRFFQPGRYVNALVYTLRTALIESWWSFALTVLALALAVPIVRDVLRLLNRGRPPGDAAWFWGALVLGPLTASLLMLLLQGMMVLAHLVFGMLLSASSVPLLVFLVEETKELIRAKVESAQQARTS